MAGDILNFSALPSESPPIAWEFICPRTNRNSKYCFVFVPSHTHDCTSASAIDMHDGVSICVGRFVVIIGMTYKVYISSYFPDLEIS